MSCNARALLARQYQAVRSHSLSWLNQVTTEDAGAQAMPDASPLKWHLAHTTWFFETFVLSAFVPEFKPWHSQFRDLFNSYYQQVSRPYPRAQRGLLTRPALSEVLAWRACVDEQMQCCIESASDAAMASTELGLQHEQQHQELMATDLLALFALNPLRPALSCVVAKAMPATAAGKASRWLEFEGGATRIGHDDHSFCFDNELPAHTQHLPPYALSSALVSNADYLGFIEAGGYDEPRWWMADGWDWVQAQRRQHPHYWRHSLEPGWCEFSLAGERPLQPESAAAHLSLFEADAYARWSGKRLPTEFEWEQAARTAAVDADVDADIAADVDAWFGSCWQWTSSSYAPYPGFRPGAGAVGEYNGKFMLNQYVLRGSSAFTPAGHARLSYRNFMPASACWQRSGVRLASDVRG